MLDNAQCQSGHSLVIDGGSSQSLFSRPLILTFYLDCHPFILAKSLKKKKIPFTKLTFLVIKNQL